MSLRLTLVKGGRLRTVCVGMVLLVSYTSSSRTSSFAGSLQEKQQVFYFLPSFCPLSPPHLIPAPLMMAAYCGCFLWLLPVAVGRSW